MNCLSVFIEICICYIDHTIINLVSLLISGTGLFTALTKFNTPELNMSFWGSNSFAIKRDKIDNVMTWILTSLVAIGLLIKASALI